MATDPPVTTTDNKTDSLLVVGGGLAALRSIEAVRQSGWTGQVTLAGAESIPPYDRPPLSKGYLDPTSVAEGAVPFRSLQQLADDLNVRVLLGHRALALDTRRREVTFANGHAEPFDTLIIATGAEPIELPGQGELDGVVGLRTIADADRIRQGLDEHAKVVVIGAGFIGSEVASAARKRGLPVTIIDSEPVPLTRSVGPDVGAICLELHRRAGTAIVLGTSVAGFESEHGHVTAVRLTDGTRIAADLVVVGVGARPATAWLEGTDIELHERDRGIICGPDLQTSVPGIWAAGDVAHAPNQTFDGALMRTEHWTNAAETGDLAGRNAIAAVTGDPDCPADHVKGIPYFWSDWYGHRIQFVGTHQADAIEIVGESGPGVIVLYRRDDRLVGALAIDRGGDIMKLRRRILVGGAWDEAVAYARERSATRLLELA